MKVILKNSKLIFESAKKVYAEDLPFKNQLLLGDGTTFSAESWNTSDYLPVSSASKIYAYGTFGDASQSDAWTGAALYNANKEFIAHLGGTVVEGVGVLNMDLSGYPNAAFIRISLDASPAREYDRYYTIG